MASPLSELEEIVLVWISTDYEGIRTISENVSRDYGEKLEEPDILQVLSSLQLKGLAQAYRLETGTNELVSALDVDKSNIDSYCWLATQIGRSVIDSEPEGL